MAKITNEIVAEVKKYSIKYPEMSQGDIAKLVGVSSGSVYNILNGMYDLKTGAKANEGKTVESQIPYETYRKLVMCEEAVKEIFRNAKTAYGEEDILFIDYRTVSSILQRCLPEEFWERLDEIKSV